MKVLLRDSLLKNSSCHPAGEGDNPNYKDFGTASYFTHHVFSQASAPYLREVASQWPVSHWKLFASVFYLGKD